MDPEQVLVTVAEVAVTLSALSGIAGVLGPRVGDSAFDQRTRILLRDVAGVGLVAALLALLPLLFDSASQAESLKWRIFSGIAAVFWVVAFMQAVPRLTRLAPFQSAVRWVGPAATLVGMLLFSWNVLSPDSASPNRYAGGLIGLLVVSGSNFVLAVFDPTVD